LEAVEQTPVKPVLPEVPSSDLYDDAMCDLYDDVVLAADRVVTPDESEIDESETDPNIRPDPAEIMLSPDAVSPDQRDDIERQFKLSPNWAGPKAKNDAAARRIVALRNARAHFYLVCGERLTEDERKAALKVGKDKTVWEPGTPIAAVLTKIAARMAKPETSDTTEEGE
jgi:hypothetical protein